MDFRSGSSVERRERPSIDASDPIWLSCREAAVPGVGDSESPGKTAICSSSHCRNRWRRSATSSEETAGAALPQLLRT